MCRVLLAEIRPNYLRVFCETTPFMCFPDLAPPWGGCKDIAGCGFGRGRTHLRGGERGCLPECCRAPQSGSTPLHRGAMHGYVAVVEQLLAAGAAVDAKDKLRGGGGTDRGGLGGRTQLCVSFQFSCFVLL